MLRITALSLGLLLIGCVESHVGPDAGRPPLADAAPPDAGSTPPVRCAPTLRAEASGEGCFCDGPVALYGDTLYRRSVGLEVWDVTRSEAPVHVRTVEERGFSNGGLAVVDDHLVALGNIQPTVVVYSLADPRDPRPVSSLELPGGSSASVAAVDGGALVLLGQTLTRIDLADPAAPRVVFEQTVEGGRGRLATDGARAFVLAEERRTEGGTFVSRLWLHVLDAARGTLESTHLLDDDPDTASVHFHAIAALDGRLLLGAPGAPVRVLEVGDELVEVGRLDVPDGGAGALAVRGDRAVALGDALRVVDLGDPRRPRLLGSAPVAEWPLVGGFVELGAGVAWVSGGSGLAAIALGCE